MKYRIKIYTYENGRTEYSAQVKISHFFNLINTWVSLSRSGENLFSEWRMQSRAEALTAIDMHFSGNHSVKSIQIQYITR